jgi:MFS family permease
MAKSHSFELESIPSSNYTSPCQRPAMVISARHGPSSKYIPVDVLRALRDRGLACDEHGVVTWQPHSISHPRQWPFRRKLYDSTMIFLLEFYMTLMSTASASIAIFSRRDLRISDELANVSFVTMFFIGQGLGGMVFPPVSEAFGGMLIYIVSTFAFAIFCLLIGLLPSLPMVVVGMFFIGVASAMPAVVGCGSLENVWDARARIWMVHMWICASVLGLAIGPPMATYLAASVLGW